jgi:carbonic anhydrase/acetyltransferase-like protein (isoleucine patch superfamily)
MTNASANSVQKFQAFLPVIGKNVFLHASAVVIGQITIGDECSIWPQAVIRGDVNTIRIGHGTNIQDLSMLHVSHQSSEDPVGAPLVIGNHVTIGHSVILHGCTIEDECLIGMGSIIMDKAVVQKHVMVAAGSLVPEGKVLESGYLYVGSPAKRIRPLTPEEISYLMYSAHHYIQLKNQYLSHT